MSQTQLHHFCSCIPWSKARSASNLLSPCPHELFATSDVVTPHSVLIGRTSWLCFFGSETWSVPEIYCVALRCCLINISQRNNRMANYVTSRRLTPLSGSECVLQESPALALMSLHSANSVSSCTLHEFQSRLWLLTSTTSLVKKRKCIHCDVGLKRRTTFQICKNPGNLCTFRGNASHCRVGASFVMRRLQLQSNSGIRNYFHVVRVFLFRPSVVIRIIYWCPVAIPALLFCKLNGDCLSISYLVPLMMLDYFTINGAKGHEVCTRFWHQV
jgi:hypothetical protein